MARDFSPISFFQRTPNVLLGRYFQDRHGVLKEIAFAELDESGSTARIIFEAFSGLPEPQQARIEAECQDIESMGHQAGVTALIDEATGGKGVRSLFDTHLKLHFELFIAGGGMFRRLFGPTASAVSNLDAERSLDLGTESVVAEGRPGL